MQVIHHGGKDTVTGSCHELQLSNRSLLIDCGILQGSETAPFSKQTFDFDLTKLIGLVITHAHIDHIGKLPWLLSAGFSQPVFCTPATAALIPLMLEDGLKLQLGFNSTATRIRPTCPAHPSNTFWRMVSSRGGGISSFPTCWTHFGLCLHRDKTTQ